MEKLQNEQALISRGMDLTAGFPDVTPDKANDQVKAVYEDIQQTLRVPVVNTIFRTLAAYPDYLEQAWQQVSPTFRTKTFERFADELRRIAVPEQQWNQTGSYWDDYKDIENIRAFNDTIYYVLPKLMIVSLALHKATFEADDFTAFNASEEITKGIAEGTHKAVLVDPKDAKGKTKDIFNAIKLQHKHPFVSSYYRGLANWPEFLEIAWSRIEMVVGSATYIAQKEKLVDKLNDGIRLLPITKIKQPALDAEEQEAVKAILAAFRSKFIPEMLLDVALIKVLLDDEAAAQHSRFSVADK